MPTLNYEIDVRCDNCGNEQTEKLPVGSPFQAYGETSTLPKYGYGMVNQQSGYRKNYGKDDHFTTKRCKKCRTAMLVRKEV